MDILKDHSDNSNGSSDISSDGDEDHIMLFPITDVDADASCESLADQHSTVGRVSHRHRHDSETEPVKAFITLRERRLLKVITAFTTFC